jgi:hypothetical protein
MFSATFSFCYKQTFSKRTSTFTPTNKYAFSPKIYYYLFGSKNYLNFSQMLEYNGNTYINLKTKKKINYFINMRTNSNKIRAKQILINDILKKNNMKSYCNYIAVLPTSFFVSILASKIGHMIDKYDHNKPNFIRLLIRQTCLTFAISFILQKHLEKNYIPLSKKIKKYFNLYKLKIPILIKINNNNNNNLIKCQIIENKIYNTFRDILHSSDISKVSFIKKHFNNYPFHPYLKNNYINVFRPICEHDINLEIKHELFYIFNKYFPHILQDLTNIIINYTVDFTYNIPDSQKIYI